jgi:hypothetical protein
VATQCHDRGTEDGHFELFRSDSHLSLHAKRLRRRARRNLDHQARRPKNRFLAANDQPPQVARPQAEDTESLDPDSDDPENIESKTGSDADEEGTISQEDTSRNLVISAMI